MTADAPSSPRRAALCGLLLAAAAWSGECAAAAMGSCKITVSAAGVLQPSLDLKTLSTRNPGGAPARATVEADAGGVLPSLVCSIGLPLNCMRLSISTPSGFTFPASANSDIVMTGSLSRAGSASLLNLLSLVILNGTYAFEFDLTSTKTTGVFGAGNYQAQQIVRCE